MKTAILTFQDAENYGAALQAYALKNTCASYSDTQVINYYNPFFHEKASRSIKSVILNCLHGNQFKRKSYRFREFQKKYIVSNAPEIRRENLEMLNGKYDVFITGSDQVWNLECSGNDSTYFLDFVKSGTKNSYAASLGMPSADDKKIKNLLMDFDKISVREASGAQYLQKVTGKAYPVVLDPTFLIDCKTWGKLFDLTFGEKYVLVYEVLNGNQLFEHAKRFAKSHKLKLVCITSSNKPRGGAQVIRDAGPIEWLKLFAGAAYIFTNSFHGLAFSLNFQKQFFVEMLPPPAKTNTRIIEMLETTGLLERSAANAEKLNDIDYNVVSLKINEDRINSLEFLKGVF